MADNIDQIYTNGNIITLDKQSPAVEAVVVRGGRVAYTGTRAEALAMAGANAVVHDLEGQTLIPGFNDNHLHTISFGSRAAAPSLTGMNAEEIVDVLKRYVDTHRDLDFLFAFDWDYPSCPNPHRDILDRAFPDIPVFLIQFSGHAVWFNTKAMKDSKLLRGGERGGQRGGQQGGKRSGRLGDSEILVDESGSPTGVVREGFTLPGVRNRVKKQFTDPELIRNGLLNALGDLAKAGITSVQDNTWLKRPVKALKELKEEGLLTCRYSCWPIAEIPLLPRWVATADYDEDWYHMGPWKHFLDGAFSSHSAWLFDEYADEPGNFGSGKSSFQILKRLKGHVRARRQAAYHSIGDRATSEFCDAVELLQKRYPWTKDLRFRIEHGQLIREEDIHRMADLGILACAQPAALIDPEKDKAILGENRASGAYPYRSLLDAGVHLSFGSDYPGEAFYEPIRAIHLAVNREGEERITAEEALRCYTTGSAYAEKKEDVKGTISVGKYADFAVLSEDILTVPADRIETVRVIETIVDGKSVYAAGGG